MADVVESETTHAWHIGDQEISPYKSHYATLLPEKPLSFTRATDTLLCPALKLTATGEFASKHMGLSRLNLDMKWRGGFMAHPAHMYISMYV